mmetsp:Transcript_9679/g.20317  ORF Transcript_9679/g.20317 Transcript_9679/m.20317 type:complete len:465 (-) Transcript_9679:2277-3671(-)
MMNPTTPCSTIFLLFSRANASNYQLLPSKRTTCFQTSHGLTHSATTTTTLALQRIIPFSSFPWTKSPLNHSESTQQKSKLNMNIENGRSEEIFDCAPDDISLQSKTENLQHDMSASAKKEKIQFQQKWRKKAPNGAKSNEEDQLKPKRSVARVLNSYLKVTIDDSVFEDLHGLVSQTIECWQDMQKSEQETIESMGSQINADEPQTEGKKQKPRNHRQTGRKKSSHELLIKQRSHRSLHITFFFCGTVLDQMTNEQLILWNASLRQLIQKKECLLSKCTLKFHSLAVFPPHRENLIVALFQNSPELDVLYEELCNLAVKKKETDNANQGEYAIDTLRTSHDVNADAEYEFPLLRDIVYSRKETQRRKSNRVRFDGVASLDDVSSPWIAHVTLGNLTGRSQAEVNRLKQWLKDIHTVEMSVEERSTLHSKVPRALQSEISVQGLSLGGPKPRNVDLDWNFPFDQY